ncbi:MAG TPA: hypothetical protein VFM46_00385 [Pseudomonadales bacterium]|nr:hypothetical protein [Pseudomonadales bacterium]
MINIAHLLAAALLVNCIPHIVHGLSGNRFQTPFAKPPGVGESSAMVNVLWGAFNFATGVLLLWGFGEFQIGNNLDTAMTGASALVTALALSWHFQRVRQK